MKKVFLASLLLFLAIAASAQSVVNGRKDGFNCVVTVSTATTVQALCSNVGDRPMFITDIQFGSSAASGTAADSFPTIKRGTGTTCGTGTAVVWQGLGAANTTIVVNLSTPIRVPPNNDLCWIMSTAGSKTIQVQGFYGAQTD